MIALISENIQVNRKNVQKLFHNTSDLVLYEFDTLSNHKALVAYFNGTIDENSLNENLLKPIMRDLISPLDIQSTVYLSATNTIKELKDIVIPMGNGSVVLFVEDLNVAHVFNLGQWPERPVEQPTIETGQRGPKEAFVEDIIVNKTLIRRRIKKNTLVFEDYVLGEETNTTVSLVYIEGIAKSEVLDDVRERVRGIHTHGVLNLSYIEDYIEDRPRTLICTVGNTERPDVAVSKLLEGRVAILCDGAPHALTVPKVFVENLHFADDYYQRARYSSFVRIIRYISFFTSFLLPGIYLALTLFHQEMIPTRLIISIAGQREGAPLAAPLETLIMLIFFEILKESSIRLPQTIGEAVTLVGGLVIGQAAVEAGFVSAAMVIIVAATGMAEFVVPNLKEMISIYRLIFTFLGAFIGLYGITCGIIFLGVHLVSLKSFGMPYMWPIAPYSKEGIKDSIMRTSLRNLDQRPNIMSQKDIKKKDEENE